MVSYEIRYVWYGAQWNIYLYRYKILSENIIKSGSAQSEKLRDEMVEDFKLNREKYEKEYEEKQLRYASKTISI